MSRKSVKTKPKGRAALVAATVGLIVLVVFAWEFNVHVVSSHHIAVAKAQKTIANATEKYGKVKWPTEKDGGAFGVFYRHQNPPVSECKNKRFVVFEMPLKTGAGRTRNIGSLYTGIITFLSWCAANDRILLLDDTNWQLAECKSKNTECYFKPLSSCSLNHTKAKGVTVLRVTNLDTMGQQKEQVLISGTDTNAWFPIAEHSNLLVGWSHPCHRLRGALLYVWRPQEWLIAAIEDNLAAAIPHWLDPQKAVGMPVRASDKCKGHGQESYHNAPGELHCKDVDEIMNHADDVRKYDPAVDTLIFTTEDPELVQEVRKYVSKLPLNKQWKMVYNVKDVMQGTGSASAVTKTSKGVTSTQQVLVSALTSLHLQLRARYLLMRYSTSWNLVVKMLFDSDQTAFANDRQSFGYDHVPSGFPNYRC